MWLFWKRIGNTRAVRSIKQKQPEAFVPLEFMPGEAMQIDWGQAYIYCGGAKRNINLFCARLCSSCAPIVFAYERQNEESFLDALVKTFEYFGGVPQRVIFDNAKVAVKEGFGVYASKQDAYAALEAHYGFEAVFCNIASGNEKGLVEGLVGWSRRNILVPLPRVVFTAGAIDPPRRLRLTPASLKFNSSVAEI